LQHVQQLAIDGIQFHSKPFQEKEILLPGGEGVDRIQPRMSGGEGACATMSPL